MTNDEACKWLANLRQDIGNPHYECLWVYEQAICEIMSMLEEQEPVVPKKWVPKGQAMARVMGYYCPVCNTNVAHGDRFCHWCGRGLKWDEV